MHRVLRKVFADLLLVEGFEFGDYRLELRGAEIRVLLGGGLFLVALQGGLEAAGIHVLDDPTEHRDESSVRVPCFVVIDAKNQQIIGSTRFYGYDPEKSEIEIGWTFLARRYWGGSYNAEMKRLLLDHAFKFVKNVVFFVGEHNFRSQHALEKIGATREGLVKRTYGNHPPHLNVKYGIKKS